MVVRSLMILTAFSSSCFAQIVRQYTRGADGTRAFTELHGDLSQPQDGFRAYDDWRTPSLGGNSLFRGTVNAGTDELADDLVLATTGPSILSDIGFSVVNMSLTSQLSDYRITIRFYDTQHTLLGLDTFHGGAISANTGVAFFSGGGFYQGLGIMLPSQILMSTQITEIVGVGAADIGIRLQGPRTTGYSSQFAYNLTTGQTLDFDGTDQTNMRYFVDTVDAPAPGVSTLMLFALPCVLSRRR